MNLSRIKLTNFHYYLLLLCLSQGLLEARKVDIFIGVPFSGPEFNIARDHISKIREQIKKAADSNGYEFNTDFPSIDQLHVTLNQIADVDEKDIGAYLACVRSVAAKMEPFDITDSVSKAEFDRLGSEYRWGVLLFPAPKETLLYKLVHRINNCIVVSGLEKGRFPEFYAHISIGQFTKKRKELLLDDFEWMPEVNLSLPQNSFVVNKILVIARERATGKRSYAINFAEYVVSLGSTDKEVKHVESQIESKKKAAKNFLPEIETKKKQKLQNSLKLKKPKK